MAPWGLPRPPGNRSPNLPRSSAISTGEVGAARLPAGRATNAGDLPPSRSCNAPGMPARSKPDRARCGAGSANAPGGRWLKRNTRRSHCSGRRRRVWRGRSLAVPPNPDSPELSWSQGPTTGGWQRFATKFPAMPRQTKPAEGLSPAHRPRTRGSSQPNRPPILRLPRSRPSPAIPRPR